MNIQLIGYDLSSDAQRQALDGEVAALAAAAQGRGKAPPVPTFCHKIPGGPWLLKTDEPVEQVFIKVDTAVAAAHHPGESPRKLLALVLANDGDEGLVGAHRGYKETADWLADVGFRLQPDEWYSPPRVLAIRCALQAPAGDDSRNLRQAIWSRFHDCCKPLVSEWFVRTSQPPDEVCRYLVENFFHDPNADKTPQDKLKLLVLHPRGPAAESGLERVRADVGWLWENGIPVKHRWGHKAP